LVFMRHIPFSLFGRNIFLKIFLSNTNNLLIMVSFSIHASHNPRFYKEILYFIS
jgi:hypothetical protein